MSNYTIKIPHIDEVTFNKNPIDTDELLVISVTVSEIDKELTPEEKYSGEFYMAEV